MSCGDYTLGFPSRTKPKLPAIEQPKAQEEESREGPERTVVRKTIVEEEPYVAVLFPRDIQTHCSSCFKKNETISCCTDCKVVYYCDVECQRKDWRIHKIECALMSAYFKEGKKVPMPEEFVRGVVRLLIRSFYGDDKSVKAFNGRTFGDLISHSKYIKAEQSDKLPVILHRINDFLGWMKEEDANATPILAGTLFHTLLTYYGRYTMNSFSITKQGGRLMGTALYLGVSELNHSCYPNLTFSFEGNKIVFASTDPELTYSRKLTIAYATALNLTTDRQDALRKMYFFTCQCPVCEDPERDHYMRSMRCTDCPNGVCPVNPTAESVVCTTCRRVQKTTVQEAMQAYLELQKFNATVPQGRLVGGKMVTHTKSYLPECVSMFEQWKDVFSPCNLEMAILAFRITYMMFVLGMYKQALPWIDKFETAFRKYNPPYVFLMEQVDDLIDSIKKHARDASVNEPELQLSEMFDAGEEVRSTKETVEGDQKVDQNRDEADTESEDDTSTEEYSSSDEVTEEKAKEAKEEKKEGDEVNGDLDNMLPPLNGSILDDTMRKMRKVKQSEELLKFYTFLFQTEFETIMTVVKTGTKSTEKELNKVSVKGERDKSVPRSSCTIS